MIAEEESPFKFLSSPAPLISIASSKVALLCWRHQINHLYPDEIACFHVNSFMRHLFTCTDQFQVPGRIRDLIDRHIKLMAEELERWWNRHDQFFDNSYEILSENFHHFALDSNGSIDSKATAKNILTFGKLSLVEKFRICCAYCLEIDIKRLWPSVSQDSHFIVDHYDDPTLHYWICLMKNELSKVPGEEGQSAEFSVVSSGGLNIWPEVEYFWNKLNETQQISQIDNFLPEIRFAKDLLLKLNQSQLDQALQNGTISRKLIYGLAIHDTNCHYVSQFWNYSKNLINEFQFVRLLYDLFRLAFIEKRFHFDHAAVLIYDVWSTAPDHLRAYVLEGYSECYFKDLFEPVKDNDMRWYGRDMRFHREILSNAKALSKHDKLWLDNWQKVMLIATPADFEKFLKIWAKDEKEIECFKDYIMDSAASFEYFDKFIETGLSDELIDYLKFCSSNEQRVRNVMMKIIVSNLNRMHKFGRFDIMVKFGKFIDRAFPTPDLAEEFKRENIRDRLENWYELLNENHLNGVKNIVECFLNSDANLLMEIKRKCFEKCKHNLSTGSFTHFRAREWNEFLLWSAPSEKEIAKFKETLPIDDVFSVLLARTIKGDLTSFTHPTDLFEIFKLCFTDEFHCAEVAARLPYLDSFLRWYFGSAEATKSFKLNKIYNYKQIDALGDILENGNSLIVYGILDWFFVQNREERKKFEEVLMMERDDDWETIEEEETDYLELEASEDEETDEDLEEID